MATLYKTGLLQSPEPPKLRFGSYFDSSKLPTIPPTFGHHDLFHGLWGMLGNDQWGDCTVAGAMHVQMLWAAMAGAPVRFTTLDAKDDYFAITGGVDSGADMVQVAKYWRDTGFRDSHAKRHRIAAYLQVNASNLNQVDAACYLFGAVGLGVKVSQEDQVKFERRVPWDRPDGDIEGYHYVPMVAKGTSYRQVVTWGALQQVGLPWLKDRLMEVVAVLSWESLVGGKSLEGFDKDALLSDLNDLGVL